MDCEKCDMDKPVFSYGCIQKLFELKEKYRKRVEELEEKPKQHPLAVAVSEIISRVESYLPDLILRETITDLYKLRFESIKWALKKVEEKHGFVPYTADHHCQLAGHKDWIVE